MSCTCQDCGNTYKVDLLIPDYLWEEIKPPNKQVGSGLLCCICIAKAIEGKDEYKVLQCV